MTEFQCAGKERFASARLAHEVNERRKATRRATKKAPFASGVYRCELCGGWHLGTPTPSAGKVR